MAAPRAPARDRKLVERLLAKDAAAFTEVVTAHHGQMLRVARSFVASQAIAEEVVQETWVAVIKGIARFEGRSSLKTWIFRILTNRAKTRGVREGRSVPFSALQPAGEPAVEPERFNHDGTWNKPPQSWGNDVPEKVVLIAEAREKLEAAIEKLPPNQATVIVLRDIQGWSSADVCDLLEVSESNQRVLLHRARSKVRGELEVYLGGAEAP